MSETVYKTVTLTELEFHKLMRYSEAVVAVELQADKEFQLLKQRVDATRKVKDDYFGQLANKYPDLYKDISYVPVEEGFELHPNVQEAGLVD